MNPKDILDERLAKGEINIQDYKEILNSISSTSIKHTTKDNKNIKLHITLLCFYFIGLMIFFMLLGGDILDRWYPYTDRPFAFLFLFLLLMNTFIGISFKWKTVGYYGALIIAIISFLNFAHTSLGALDEASSLVVNLLLIINIVAVYIFFNIRKKR